jgi:hypothetical protein
MKNSRQLFVIMKGIDAENENYRYKIAENMRQREQLLREYNEAKENEAKSVFIANKEGLKEVSKYL